jgi:oxalate decarboxylase/phosphoglucose isomerase-like protein (cupin superfamily)
MKQGHPYRENGDLDHSTSLGGRLRDLGEFRLSICADRVAQQRARSPGHDHPRLDGAGRCLGKTRSPGKRTDMAHRAGSALLLMADGQTDALRAGDVVRTPAGTIHGVANTGSEQFIYLAVTTPPQDFTVVYKGRQTSN